jgi:hypothetical protein
MGSRPLTDNSTWTQDRKFHVKDIIMAVSAFVVFRGRGDGGQVCYLSPCFHLLSCKLGGKSRLKVNVVQFSHHLNCVVFGKWFSGRGTAH